QHVLQHSPCGFFLVRRCRRLTYNHIILTGTLFLGELDILGLLITNDTHQASIREILLDEVEQYPALFLAIAAKRIEDRGQGSHGGLLALVFENTRLGIVGSGYKLQVDTSHVTNSGDR